MFKKSRIFMLIFLVIVIWIQSPVKVLDSQEDIINSDGQSINEKDNIFVYETAPAPKEEVVEHIPKPKYKTMTKPTTRPTPKYKTMTMPTPTPRIKKISNYGCDGRRYCSQMRSCGEAKFFIRNCPGTLMDGDGDGIPCESQHCGSW